MESWRSNIPSKYPMLPCGCSLINRSQMTSKCGKNKKSAHELEAAPSVPLMLLPQTHGKMKSICFI